ncbi:MAG: 2Fe-2S iron-sulfur cluster binding domain-containing protein [Chitinivibrionales bacterium]|nr:2Fe-2S iron-sulfur cluster binding domain-containing protein [Chitinivibrionales bacterium]
MKEISFIIDGQKVRAQEGQTVLNAADDAGIFIPRLCNHPDLEPFGACRMCTVLINGKPQTACTHPASDGLEIQNDTPQLFNIRKSILDMLFIEGNHYCMFCEKSGFCELQALAYRFGITRPKFPYQYPRRTMDATHPDIFIDHDRCILCARCVRASRDVDHKHVFGFVGRGTAKKLAVSSAKGARDTNVSPDDKALSVCPVGTLMRKHVGYSVPIGKRLFDLMPIGSDIEEHVGKQGKE